MKPYLAKERFEPQIPYRKSAVWDVLETTKEMIPKLSLTQMYDGTGYSTALTYVETEREYIAFTSTSRTAARLKLAEYMLDGRNVRLVRGKRSPRPW